MHQCTCQKCEAYNPTFQQKYLFGLNSYPHIKKTFNDWMCNVSVWAKSNLYDVNLFGFNNIIIWHSLVLRFQSIPRLTCRLRELSISHAIPLIDLLNILIKIQFNMHTMHALQGFVVWSVSTNHDLISILSRIRLSRFTKRFNTPRHLLPFIFVVAMFVQAFSFISSLNKENPPNFQAPDVAKLKRHKEQRDYWRQVIVSNTSWKPMEQIAFMSQVVVFWNVAHDIHLKQTLHGIVFAVLTSAAKKKHRCFADKNSCYLQQFS